MDYNVTSNNHINHLAKYVNIVFVDGHVEGVFNDTDLIMTALTPAQKDKIFDEADKQK